MVNNKLTSGASDLYLRHFGMGINEWRILSVLSNTPGSGTAHICETVGMHKAVASRSLRELEAKAMIQIERVEGQRVMVLTPAGQAMHDQLAAVALHREVLLMSAFTTQEQALLRDFLRRMRAVTDAVNAWEPPARAPVRNARPKRGTG
jgi:DNA-binding MarR family transcriptional regulator